MDQLPACPYCESSDVRFSHRAKIRERAASLFGIRPIRCRECRMRYWQVHRHIWDGRLISLLYLLFIRIASSPQRSPFPSEFSQAELGGPFECSLRWSRDPIGKTTENRSRESEPHLRILHCSHVECSNALKSPGGLFGGGSGTV